MFELRFSSIVQLADAAIEEQLEVQTAFREHGARLQQIYDKRQRTDMDIARREQEMKQLQGGTLSPASFILMVAVASTGTLSGVAYAAHDSVYLALKRLHHCKAVCLPLAVAEPAQLSQAGSRRCRA